MQVIENWADVRGRVVGVRPHPTLPGYRCAQVAIHDVAPVAGFANLFASAAGETVEINLPAASAAPTPGAEVAWRIRKAGPNATFVHPDSVKAN